MRAIFGDAYVEEDAATTTAEALAELMNKYNDLLAEWIATFGNGIGFDDWFTGEVQP